MISSLSLAVRKKQKKERIMVLPELYEDLLIEILIRLPMNLAHHVESSSHDDHSVSVIDQDLSMPIMGGYFLNACRGLVCFTVGSRVQICNLNTRQLVELPIILTPQGGEDYNIWYYLGHDPVHDEYKVLSFIWRHNREQWKVRSEHHVLVLGAGASWKMTQCHIHHFPYCQGITINSVLYYGAWTDDKKCVLMSFDLSSEDVRVWVIEDVNKSQWSHKKTFVLPTDFAQTYDFVMGGTGHSGKGNEITRKIEISPSLLGSFKQTDLLLPTLWDDTESIMYLET
ncbi:predicted protein [Arabidopsis lyrata subsp. lyrata]|uniref:Predicted protein n=1 Tax=Arabidopsis lyrata subsp. lyrata TaxID=81972 RepID=D7LU52_ARALL|nr:predicted protein [Arabidopsis lyrata subsp. lyrata]